MVVLLCLKNTQGQTLAIEQVMMTSGNTAVLTITASSGFSSNFIGLEGGLYLPNGVEVLDVSSPILTGFSNANFTIASSQQVAISWVDMMNPANVPDGSPIFTITIQANSASIGQITFGNNPLNNAPAQILDNLFNPTPISSTGGNISVSAGSGAVSPTQNEVNVPAGDYVPLLILLALVLYFQKYHQLSHE